VKKGEKANKRKRIEGGKKDGAKRKTVRKY
jgi:hypothetical protein